MQQVQHSIEISNMLTHFSAKIILSEIIDTLIIYEISVFDGKGLVFVSFLSKFIKYSQRKIQKITENSKL